MTEALTTSVSLCMGTPHTSVSEPTSIARQPEADGVVHSGHYYDPDRNLPLGQSRTIANCERGTGNPPFNVGPRAE